MFSKKSQNKILSYHLYEICHHLNESSNKLLEDLNKEI
jgi:hypothetical protein